MPPRRAAKPSRPRARRADADAAEIAELEARIAETAPPRGVDAGAPPPPPPKGAPPRGVDAGASPTTLSRWPPMQGRARFDELPLSTPTLRGLADAGFFRMTAVQRAALPHALAGRDVLAAAKTGSGKTLAFLVPLLDALHRERWCHLDGTGALVLTPTRELATQIFGVLAKVGSKHDFSAGLVTGGHDLAAEAVRVAGLNILIATPGRLLQHLDETPGFALDSLKLLVLDEADRLLDAGFAATLDAIVAGLPRARQTLLFSATQTKRVADLARLSLTDPERVAVHEAAAAPTPARLAQAFAVVPLPSKPDVVWAFIKAHLHARTLIFFATCKQVRFFFEAFRRLRPGVPLRALHGKMKHGARHAAFDAFSNAKGGAVLLATDVAARGLDFPAVDWVLQADAPDDAATYVHRVGRTARYAAAGRALLLVTPEEKESAIRVLSEEGGIPLTETRVNAARAAPVSPALAALLSKDAELKAMAQRAVSAYIRSVGLRPATAAGAVDAATLPIAEFAASLGLAAAPRVRVVKRKGAGKGAEAASGSSEEDESDAAPSRSATPPPAADDAPAPALPASDDDDDLLVVKTRAVPPPADAPPPTPALDPTTNCKRKKLRIPAGGGPARGAAGARVVFTDDGDALPPLAALAAEKAAAAGHGTWGGDGDDADARLDAAAATLAARDAADKAAYAAERKRRRLEKKVKARARARGEAVEGVRLGRADSESSDASQSPSPDLPRAVARPDVACLGMARRDEVDEVAAAEAAALRLLQARRAAV